MSIKIYDAFKLPKMSLSKLYEFNLRIKKDINNIILNNYCEVFAKKLVRLYDDMYIGEVNEFKSLHAKYRMNNIFYIVKCFMQDEEKNVYYNNERNPEFDFKTHILYYPYKGKILVSVRTEQYEVVNYFDKLSESTDYYYQNSTDKPDSITTRDWNQRRKDWLAILDDDLVSPLRVDFGDTYGLILHGFGNYKLIQEHIDNISLDKRLTNLAEDKFVKDYVNDMTTNNHNLESYDVIKFIRQGMSKFKDKEDEFVVNMVNKIKDNYKNLIIDKINIQDFHKQEYKDKWHTI